MTRTYKVWVEIEVLDDGEPVTNGTDELGILPDSLGTFNTPGEAVAQVAQVILGFGVHPENSDAVKVDRMSQRLKDEHWRLG